LLVFWGGGIGEVLLSLGDLRATVLSLRVTRGDVGMEDELDLFMQLSVSPQVVAKLDAVDHAIVLEVM
jgi:hypothetical protein